MPRLEQEFTSPRRRKIDRKCLENVEIWCLGRMEEIGWTVCVKMKKYCVSQGGQENPIYSMKVEG
jgi:hypothetical protein